MINKTELNKIKNQNNQLLNMLKNYKLEKQEVAWVHPNNPHPSLHLINTAHNIEEYLYSMGLWGCLEVIKDCDFYTKDSNEISNIREYLDSVLEGIINSMDKEICLCIVIDFINDFIQNCNKYDKYDDATIREIVRPSTDMVIHNKSFKKTIINNMYEFISEFYDDYDFILYDYIEEFNKVEENDSWEDLENLFVVVRDLYSRLTYEDVDEYETGDMFDDLNIAISDVYSDASILYRLSPDEYNTFRKGRLNIELVYEDVQEIKNNIIDICVNYSRLLQLVYDNIEDFRQYRKTNYISLYVMCNYTRDEIDFKEFIQDIDKRFNYMYYLLNENNNYNDLKDVLVDYRDIVEVAHYRDLKMGNSITEHIFKALILEDYENSTPLYLNSYRYFPHHIDNLGGSLLEYLGPQYTDMLVEIMNKTFKNWDKYQTLVDILLNNPSVRTGQYELVYHHYKGILDMLLNIIQNDLAKMNYKEELGSADEFIQGVIYVNPGVNKALTKIYEYLYTVLKIVSCMSYDDYMRYNNRIVNILVSYIDIFVDNPKIEDEIITKSIESSTIYASGTEEPTHILDQFKFKDSNVKYALIEQMFNCVKNDFILAKNIVKYMTDVPHSISEDDFQTTIKFTPFILLDCYDYNTGSNLVKNIIIEDEFLSQILMEVELDL